MTESFKIISNNLSNLKLRSWIDINKLNWENLSLNPNATDLIEQNLDKIKFSNCYTEDVVSIKLLEKNLYKVNWKYLSKNPNAIQLLKDNINQICWHNIWLNENFMDIVGEIDYEAMRNAIKPLAEEIAQYVFNPIRIQKLANTFELTFEEILEIY